MARVIHPIAGALALLTIATFWLSTIVVELLGSRAAVVALKTTIPWGFLWLVPALAVAAATGSALAKGQRRGLVGAKVKRMPFIAANGLLVILPCALFLAFKAHARQLDVTFYAVQALELVAGATNLLLLGLSMRDGLAATAWKRGSFLRSARTREMRVLGVDNIAQGTLALRLKKPSGFAYRAGQAVYVTLSDVPESDDRGCIRTFSMASTPHEQELVVAVRTGDSTFKRALKVLGDTAKVQVEGPYGDLFLADTARPAVFLAGGIGITPFRSMILDAVERRLQRRLVLLYSNRMPESAAFLGELSALETRHPSFELVATMTDAPPGSDWRGERGPITREMLARYVGSLAAPVYYVAGPSRMVAAMVTLLRDAGVQRADIHAEMFAGY